MNYKDILVSRESKVNFINGLVRLAKVDGSTSPEESQYFISAAIAMGLTQEDVAEINNHIQSEEPIEIRFDTSPEKLLFFREGIQLCAVNESYDADERAEVRVLAASLNVPESEIQRIEAWVEEGMAWKKRGDALLALSCN